ncbi:metal-dependent transcriptional regulator [Deinococcus maricopensis]|uniref:Manganese transport regulator n=1 Tax=Deinococcus maricopensis (strain DSM 21211 / LMG 22137 / NRRL B-23946 / LB-34) TaxID=709986 RepID=E8U8J4_DEIML|nr:metal-dependent transcriptional regulator [Deinococcus maricopensis]ADV67383.1 iron (metal) dependent repressor, DtxR family [Deinococcus maricopensis DSM 21211]
MRERLTPPTEDCLKAIYERSEGGKAGTQDLALTLGISGASVTGMLKRLAELKLVEYQPYQGVQLTEAGTQVALEIIRHHRLLETYLHRALGVPLDELHDEADRLEHHISEALEARLFAALGEPTHDPHGDPIPTLAGEVPRVATRALSGVGVGEVVRVGRVAQDDPARLRHLVGAGLVPGAEVRVTFADLLAGVLRVMVAGHEVLLSVEVAQRVWVEDVDATHAGA